MTQATARKTLEAFLGRVERVTADPYYLGKVTKVVLFGSYLREDATVLSDVDVAVVIEPKEPDADKHQRLNYQRVHDLEEAGRRIDTIFEQVLCGCQEVARYLKGRSPTPSLHDYKNDHPLVDAGPHRILLPASRSAIEEVLRL